MLTGQLATISKWATWLSPVIEPLDDSTGEQDDLSANGLTVDLSVTIESAHRHCVYASATIANGKAFLTAPAPAGIQWQFEVTDLACLCAGSYRLIVILTINGFVTDLVDGTIAVTD